MNTLIISALVSQNLFAKTYGGIDLTSYWAHSITYTSDGGYALAGERFSTFSGDFDLLVLKLDPSGNLTWARTFGGTNDESAGSIIQTPDGGYAVAGYTDSYGMGGGPNLLILKIDPNGNYTDCVQSCSPTVGMPTISSFSPIGLATCNPTPGTPDLGPNTPNLVPLNVCVPFYEDIEEIGSGSQPRITCSPAPAAVIFNAPDAMPIKIYSPDGRLAYSGNLLKGQTRISLDPGVYLWQAGDVGAGLR
ncbi:MAG: hypothetical protein ACPL68_06910, partial [Candidatus Hydrothermia bacterium]